MRAGAHGCLHALFKHTLKRVRTEWKMHAVNFQLGLSASFLTLLLSPHPNRHFFSVICRTHSLFSQSSSTAWHSLVNLFKLYGTDTQLVVGALTRKKKKRLGLLQTGAVNRDRMDFTGLQGLSYSQTIQLICQGDPECSPPSLWFVHSSVCLQTGQVIKMGASQTHSPSWHPAIPHLTTIWSLFVLFFILNFLGPKKKMCLQGTQTLGTLM